MAIKSAINPAVATPTRSTSYKSFQNFITGGSDLGTSVVSNAANKIVNFQRGATGVAPRVPDLGSIIQTLSTNILNNVEGRVDSINQNVNNVVNKFIQKLEGNYQSKMQSIDATGPSKILQNFLSLYDKAIGYIQFFANPRNVKNLAENLKDLRNVFSETFEVAKNIRKTIVRVVNQLSNLPTASAGGSGLNLDIDLPGAPLKKGGAPLRRGVRGRGRGALLGAGALGLGTGMVTSALAQPGGEVQPVATETGGGISQPILEKFSAILDRFDAAIKSLSKVKKPEPSADTKGPTPSAAKDTSGGGGGGRGGGGPAGEVSTEALKGNNNAEKIYNQLIQEGFTPQAAAGVIGNIMQESGADPTKKQYGGGPGRGLIQWGTGKGSGERYDRLTAWAKKSGKDPLALETQYQYMMMEMKERGTYRRLKDVKDVNQATLLFEDEMTQAGKPMMENRYKFAQSALKQYGSGTLQPGKPGVAGKPGEAGAPGKPGVSTTTNPKVAPATTQQQASQQVAQQVSQPAVIQTQPQVNIAPLNMGQQGARGMQKPPTTSAGRISGESSIPFLPTGNPDNFLTLYSKMVYNIVDG